MPIFTISEVVLDLHRRAVMLDTNVVYAAFSKDDSRHGDCLAYLDLEEQYLLPLSVVVETWGLLVGRDRNWDSGLRFLSWLNNPSSSVVVVNHSESMARIHDLARSMRVDCVDATILYLADRISKQCGYAPGIRVATYDIADFLRSLKAYKFSFTLFDLRSLDPIELTET
jgi:predicted nucleic acid-binding protein